MKKTFLLLATAFTLNASVAKSTTPPLLLDDSSSFRIARSVKLGYGESTKPAAPTKHELNVCFSDDDCPSSQKCTDNKCVDVCTSTTCSGETPDCEIGKHTHTCKCTETSCGEVKMCSDGKCEPCAVGSRCNCAGDKVVGSEGTCVCPPHLTCSAGQYLNNDCLCKSCTKDYEPLGKCGCPGKTYPDGSGGCYCKETKTCPAGFSFDDTNSCECVACTSNDNCDNPCPDNAFLNGNGCEAYTCMTDTDCGAGTRCQNGGTTSAQCVPCGKNEQCRCPDGQLSDGSGKCVAVTCKTGLVCGGSVSGQCCTAGMRCLNPDTVESSCASCEKNTQCTCSAGYVSDGNGSCVKPACSSDNDCSAGKYCANAGTVAAQCVNCTSGQTCTCTGGMVADGNGGCKFACEFSSASACVSGRANCSNCVLSGGCYVCSACATGYELSSGSCKVKACASGYSTSTTSCPGGYTLYTNGKSGSQTCGKCVKTGCTSNNDCSGSQYCSNYKCTALSCGTCYTASNHTCTAKSGCCTSDSQCASNQKCTNNACTTLSCGTCYTVGNHTCTAVSGCCTSNSQCASNQKCSGNKCVLKTCAEQGYATSCSSGYVKSNATTGSDGQCYSCSVKTCSSGYGYYNGTKCSAFSGYAFRECRIEYQSRGATCSSKGQLGSGACDVDAWRSCCEYCVGL